MIIIFHLFFSSFSFSAESITCSINNLPESKLERFVLLKEDSSSSLVGLFRGAGFLVKETVLARELECSHAKSDSRIVNCLHRAPEGSNRVSDISLTIIKHSYVSAGRAFDRSGEEKDVLSENFRLYFRDDRNPGIVIDRHFAIPQCRTSSESEIKWAKSVLVRE